MHAMTQSQRSGSKSGAQMMCIAVLASLLAATAGVMSLPFFCLYESG